MLKSNYLVCITQIIAIIPAPLPVPPTQILQQVWPFVGQYLEKLLVETIAPSIRASSTHLQTLTFTKVDFGDKVTSKITSPIHTHTATGLIILIHDTRFSFTLTEMDSIGLWSFIVLHNCVLLVCVCSLLTMLYVCCRP